MDRNFVAIFKDLSDKELGRGYFETQVEAENWISKQLKKPYYLSHRAIYTIRFEEGTYVPPEIQNGNIGMDWITIDEIRYMVYTMPAEYTYEIIDRSQEVIDEKAEKKARRLEIQQIKAAIAEIDSWATPQEINFNYFKKILKRLVKELR